MFINIRQDFARRERVRRTARDLIRKHGFLATEYAESWAAEAELSRAERHWRAAVTRTVGGLLVDSENVLGRA